VSGPGWLSRRVPKLYWRGGATGSLRGWRPGAAGRAAHTHNQGPGHETSSSRLSSLLLNKRLLLTLMARPHLEMDVAVNRLRIDKTWGERDLKGCARDAWQILSPMIVQQWEDSDQD
jgi:hypothetical protein